MAELLTTAQLAKRLQVSPGTIRDWAHDGRIPQIRLSQKSRRFVLGDVLAALNQKAGAKR